MKTGRMSAIRMEARHGSRRIGSPNPFARFIRPGGSRSWSHRRLRAWAVLCLAFLGPAAVLAAGAGTAAPRSSGSASPLTINWHYFADAEQGSFTLFRGADLDALLPVLEVPVRAGIHKYRFSDSGGSHRNWFFQLRYRGPDGRETSLAITYYEGKPEVDPGSDHAVEGPGQRALTSSVTGLVAPGSFARSVEVEAVATSAFSDPPTPPPRSV